MSGTMPGDNPWKAFAGKWQIDRGENVDDYFKELGVNMILRKIIVSAKSEVNITVDGDKITIHAAKQDPNTFVVNGPEVETNFSGKKARARAAWVGDKLIIDVSATTDGSISKPQKITRQIVNGELVMTMEIGNVKAVRYLKRI